MIPAGFYRVLGKVEGAVLLHLEDGGRRNGSGAAQEALGSSCVRVASYGPCECLGHDPRHSRACHAVWIDEAPFAARVEAVNEDRKAFLVWSVRALTIPTPPTRIEDLLEVKKGRPA